MIDEKHRKANGKRLVTALAARGMKQKDLAQQMGMKAGSETVISKFCSGDRVPNVEQILSMSSILDIPAGYLMGDDIPLTRDQDIAAVCKYTGLSVESVQFLNDLYKESKLDTGWRAQNILKVMNLLLSGTNANLEFWSRLQAFMFASGGDFSLNLTTGKYDIPRDDLLATLLTMNNAYLQKLKSSDEEG